MTISFGRPFEKTSKLNFNLPQTQINSRLLTGLQQNVQLLASAAIPPNCVGNLPLQRQHEHFPH